MFEKKPSQNPEQIILVTQKETNHHKLEAGTREYFDIFEKKKTSWNMTGMIY